LAECERRLQHLDDAARHAREATAIAEDLSRQSPLSSAIQVSVGRLAIIAGRIASAERNVDSATAFSKSAHQTFEQLAQRAPQMVDVQVGLARACAFLAGALATTSAPPVAEIQRLRRMARDILDGLRREARLFPEDEASWKTDELDRSVSSTRADVLRYE
jgi:predicted Zn-dependent protease